jgi:hexosaminidase
MINLYLIQVFKCSKIQEGKIAMNVIVRSTDIMLPTDIKHEKYSLIIRNNSKWELSADYYPGFLRGLETFSQLFEMNEKEEYVIYNVPVVISDAPQYLWRAVMIDTSRHFLPVATIKRAIDAMMYSKLNVLHWHITDEDAFPLYIPTLPELSEAGSIGGVYS